MVAPFGGYLEAEEPVSPHWLITQSISASVNPLGLDFGTRLSYKAPLYEGKRGVLWDPTHWEGGIENSLTPAYDTLSVFIKVLPIAIFDLKLQAGVRYFHDTLGFGYTPLTGYDAPFDSATRKNMERSNEFGFRYQVSPTLQGAVGNLLFAHTLHGVAYDMRGAKDSAAPYFYEPSANLILRTMDFLWTNDTVVAYRIRERRRTGADLVAGALHTLSYVPRSGYVTQRVTLLGALALPVTPQFDVSITSLLGVHLRDQYYAYDTGKIYGALQFRGQWKRLVKPKG